MSAVSSAVEPVTSLGFTADSIADDITYLERPSANDANVIYYVSGAIARSVVRGTRCDSCREALICTEALEPPEIDGSMDCTAFLDSINRGGLTCPSEYVFELAVHCWCIFEQIRGSQELMSQFLTAPHQRALFAKIVDRVSVPSSESTSFDIFDNVCTSGHDLKELLVHRFFNCVAKNLVKELTNKANAQGRQMKRCKIAKLQSDAPSQ